MRVRTVFFRNMTNAARERHRRRRRDQHTGTNLEVIRVTECFAGTRHTTNRRPNSKGMFRTATSDQNYMLSPNMAQAEKRGTRY